MVRLAHNTFRLASFEKGEGVQALNGNICFDHMSALSDCYSCNCSSCMYVSHSCSLQSACLQSACCAMRLNLDSDPNILLPSPAMPTTQHRQKPGHFIFKTDGKLKLLVDEDGKEQDKQDNDRWLSASYNPEPLHLVALILEQ